MEKMRYEVVLVSEIEGIVTQYPPILKTNDRHEAFSLMGKVKKRENKEPYCEYDEVRVLDKGVWVARMRLF